MFDFFQPVIDVFSFIGSILSSIIDGIYGTIQIISSLFELILSIFRIFPNPLYACLLTFVSIYSVIFIYKIFRKG